MNLYDALEDCAKYNSDLQCEIPFELIGTETSATPIKKRLFILAAAIVYDKENPEGKDWRDKILSRLRVEQIRLIVGLSYHDEVDNFIKEFGSEVAKDVIKELIRSVSLELIPIALENEGSISSEEMFNTIEKIDYKTHDCIRSDLLWLAIERFKKHHVDTNDWHLWSVTLILRTVQKIAPVICKLVCDSYRLNEDL